MLNNIILMTRLSIHILCASCVGVGQTPASCLKFIEIKMIELPKKKGLAAQASSAVGL